MASRKGTTPPDVPRLGLGILTALHAPVFILIGMAAPWRTWSGFTMVCFVIASLHLAVFICCVADWRVAARRSWRILSLASLLAFSWTIGSIVSAGLYLIDLYGGVGQGMALAAGAAASLPILLTLPIALWGLGRVGTGLPWRAMGLGGRTTAPIGLLAAALATTGCWFASTARAYDMLPPQLSAEGLARDLQSHIRAGQRESVGQHDPDLSPVECDAPLTPRAAAGDAFVFLFSRSRTEEAGTKAPAVRGLCRRLDARDLAATIGEALRSLPATGPVKIDIVRRIRPVRPLLGIPILDPLRLRPGRDGVCLGARCLTPWQLLARNSFARAQPLRLIPDLRIGVALSELRDLLSAPENDRRRHGPNTDPTSSQTLTAMETISLLVQDGRVVELHGLFPQAAPLRLEALSRAARSAEHHIVRAADARGKFRYTRHPFRNTKAGQRFSLARQAGTTLVLCELGRSELAETTIRQSLDFMRAFERTVDGHSQLSRRKKGKAALGDSALPLIAYLRCRGRTGEKHDPLMGRLVSRLLAAQRESGRFHSEIDLSTGAAIHGPDTLYAAGQAVYALLLVEQALATAPIPNWPPPDQIRDAVSSAMGYYAGPYWDHAWEPFFYSEENWHCLAAASAVDFHRDPHYERFCLNYIEYQSRFILDRRSGVLPQYRGGHGFSNLMAPHNTPTASIVEGLVAAVAIKKARGESPQTELEKIAHTLRFLVNQQWRDEICFACVDPSAIRGAFSQSMHLPNSRIDYTQHAWAAIGHGARALREAGWPTEGEVE
ncbi:MAG: hypothetical protein V3V08_20850 [Nannocystaceae bacterium]